MSVSLESNIQRKTVVVHSNLDSASVLLNPISDGYFGLNGVGSRIWELIGENTSVSQVVQQLAAEYDVEAETCQSDVIAFVNEIAAGELIEINE